MLAGTVALAATTITMAVFQCQDPEVRTGCLQLRLTGLGQGLAIEGRPLPGGQPLPEQLVLASAILLKSKKYRKQTLMLLDVQPARNLDGITRKRLILNTLKFTMMVSARL